MHLENSVRLSVPEKKEKAAEGTNERQIAARKRTTAEGGKEREMKEADRPRPGGQLVTCGEEVK